MPWNPPNLPENPKPPTRNEEKKTIAGTAGKSIQLQANHYPITVKSWDKPLFHYDVVIEEPNRSEHVLGKKKKLLIFEELKRTYPHFFKQYCLAYDGMKSAVSVGKIKELSNGQKHEVCATGESGKKSRYFVSLKIVKTYNLKELYKPLQVCKQGTCVEIPSIIFQMMEIMFRHTPSNRFLSVGRNSFFPMDKSFGASSNIGEGKIVSQGFFGSIRPGWKLFLNVDVVHAAFYKEQSVLDFIRETVRLPETDFERVLTEKNRLKLETQLKGLKVRVTHTAKMRTYKVIGVMENGADTQMFKIEKGKFVSVEKYFAETYPRYPLHYPKLNVIRVAPPTRTIYLPIEYCKIKEGQKVTKTLNENARSQFIQFTARTPAQRLQKCNNIVKENRFSDDPMMKALGFTISDKPVELNGRILPTPMLAMKRVDVEPNKGVWEARNKQFYKGADIKFWAVVNYDNTIRAPKLWEFLDTLMRLAKERGMGMSQPSEVITDGRNPEKDFDVIRKKVSDIQLIFVNLPSKTGDFYGRIKMIGDREIGVVTQCILSKNLRNMKDATINNVLLKINGKMRGINNTLGRQMQTLIFATPVIIFGADVNHPPADERSGTPSLAAVVGSMDRFASNYAVQVRQQFANKEIIQDLRDMTRNLLMQFYIENRRNKPERLIMYRDGVSESQFDTVLAYELCEMRKACTSLQENYKPAITFIVVQKRHHTRLFCNERDGVGKSRNVPPGTIVDTIITHPSEIDFFLNSHQGLLGTSRPTHYRLLWDDNDMSMDNLQAMTYALCHTCFRCTRSVSIPAPAYYAHLAAYRAKVHGGACEKPQMGKDRSVPDISNFVKMDQNFTVHNRMYFL